MRILTFLISILCFSSCNSSDPSPKPSGTPVFSMDPLVLLEGEQNKSAFVNLRLDKSSDSPVTVILETVDLTATEGEDYLGFPELEITFDSGVTQANCQVTIIGDDIPENDEEFELRIKEINGANAESNVINITIENDDQSFEVIIPSGGTSSPTEYAGMTLLWSDEFEGTQLDESNWTWELGNGSWGWGNNELEFYKKENTIFKDGHLVIQAREENHGGYNYTSSRLKTQNKFDFTHGRVDIRAVVPGGQGIWPALWMLGSNITTVSWPQCGEIDIMELVGHEPSKIHGTAHYSDATGNRLMSGASKSISGAKFSDAFHVFSVVWSEDNIEWRLDDQKFYSVNKTSLGSQNPYPFNDPFFLIMNVAVGGNWPGNPNASTTFPQNMIVDYIRIFQEN